MVVAKATKRENIFFIVPCFCSFLRLSGQKSVQNYELFFTRTSIERIYITIGNKLTKYAIFYGTKQILPIFDIFLCTFVNKNRNLIAYLINLL